MRQNKPKQKRPLHSQSFPDTSLANPAKESRQHHHDASLSSGPITRPCFQAHPSGLPNQPTVNMHGHGHGDQPSYAAIINKPPSVPTTQTGFQPSVTNSMLEAPIDKLYDHLENLHSKPKPSSLSEFHLSVLNDKSALEQQKDDHNYLDDPISIDEVETTTKL